MNDERPIVAGGTGANSASAARTNLKTEVAAAGQQVTNYSSHVWETGSFFSALGATDAPTANAFFGTAILNGADQGNIVIEARDTTTGIKYMRKKSGTWGAWTADSGAGAFVQKAGDTMTGDLMISKASPLLTLNKTGAGQNVGVVGSGAGVTRWSVNLANNDPESTGNAGSNFNINRFADNGTLIGTPFAINRATGNVTLTGQLAAAQLAAASATLTGQLAAASAVLTGSLSVVGITSTGTVWVASPLVVDHASQPQNFFSVASVNKGSIFFHNSTNTMRINVVGALADFFLDQFGICALGIGFKDRAGQSGAYGTHVLNFNWTGSALQFWSDTTNVGNITITCDYRTKENVHPLDSTWDKVKALNPVKYNNADYPPLFERDDVERWGFLAHELQQTLLPSAATGSKDQENLIQSPDLMSVVAALTRTVQELQMRVETLEARQ
ncbi:MAG: tail fiber domain-containing protein [Hyphomicrobiaceae bacterium]|nr:MAG: tail fiber domain-containing protein [Hyphomicrobiaceae bacterium]